MKTIALVCGLQRIRTFLEVRCPSLFYQLRTLWIYVRGGRAAGVVEGLTFDTARTYEPLFAEAVPQFTRIVEPYRSEFKWPVGRLFNGKFGSVDAELMYATIRTYKPRRMIEVGCGHSTAFAHEAFRANGVCPAPITCIDPDPRTRLPAGVTHLARRVEDADVNLFASLQANDILSIDSSHLTEEAAYHLRVIYPLLKPGVLVHTHDIFFPYRAVNPEEPMVLDFYAAMPQRIRVLTGSCYVRYYHPELVTRLVPSARWAIDVPAAVPTSLWAVVL